MKRHHVRMKEEGKSRWQVANFSKEVLWSRVGRWKVERSEWGKTGGPLNAPVTEKPPSPASQWFDTWRRDLGIQEQTRKDVGVPQVSSAGVLMQGDVGSIFAFLLWTVASCRHTHPDGSLQWAADSPSHLHGGGPMWPVAPIPSPLLRSLRRQMPGPVCLSLELSYQGSALSPNPDLYCMKSSPDELAEVWIRAGWEQMSSPSLHSSSTCTRSLD